MRKYSYALPMANATHFQINLLIERYNFTLQNNIVLRFFKTDGVQLICLAISDSFQLKKHCTRLVLKPQAFW